MKSAFKFLIFQNQRCFFPFIPLAISLTLFRKTQILEVYWGVNLMRNIEMQFLGIYQNQPLVGFVYLFFTQKATDNNRRFLLLWSLEMQKFCLCWCHVSLFYTFVSVFYSIHLIPKSRPINYSFVCMFISPLCLIFTWKFFCVFYMLTRHQGLINMQTKE